MNQQSRHFSRGRFHGMNTALQHFSYCQTAQKNKLYCMCSEEGNSGVRASARRHAAPLHSLRLCNCVDFVSITNKTYNQETGGNINSLSKMDWCGLYIRLMCSLLITLNATTHVDNLCVFIIPGFTAARYINPLNSRWAGTWKQRKEHNKKS